MLAIEETPIFFIARPKRGLAWRRALASAYGVVENKI
jgi:hypothetical protein